MELDIIRADPAGNITVFVLNPPAGKAERTRAAKALMAGSGLKAEQTGFVYPPREPGGLWRLEMAGGEFCGNASRSFGLWVAVQSGLHGKHTVMIKTSGITEPVPVFVDTEAQTAEIVIPGPVSQTEMSFEGERFPVYEFEGITHIIAENVPAGGEPARSLLRETDETFKAEGRELCDAFGVMFYDTAKKIMRPAVWVRETDTLVFESSCGSGSAALGVWAVRGIEDGQTEFDLAQPGGTITVRVAKQAGAITRLSISGKVALSETFRYRC
jgi:diaminopimelate epimerase